MSNTCARHEWARRAVEAEVLEVGDPFLDFGTPDIADCTGPPPGLHADASRRPGHCCRGWFEVRLCGEPSGADGLDGGLLPCGVYSDVGARGVALVLLQAVAAALSPVAHFWLRLGQKQA